jgi:hypothetical protein
MPQTMLIGVGWYSPDQWSKLKLVADDSETLDSNYEEWRAGVEKTLQELRSQPGIRAVKVSVDVQALQQWCRDRGKRLDGEARVQFIVEKVRDMSAEADDA